MGLAGPRKRRKISSDPNNTNWARGQGFGHTVLLSQGWTPGEGLGRTNASYGDGQPRSSANAVKAVLREENLGLGAKNGNDRNHGLDILQGVLGRLNGKSNEALEKEEQARRNVQCALYAEQRWGSLRFVSGGTLTGATTMTIVSTPLEEVRDASHDTDDCAPAEASPEDKGGEASSSDSVKKAERKNRKSKSKETLKKEKRSKHRSKSADEGKDSDAQNKESRKAAKKERKRLQAEERRRKDGRGSSDEEEKAGTPVEVTQAQPVSNTAYQPPVQRMPQSSRFHVRQRYIQQKRMAMMDSTALKEILLGQS